MNAKVRRKLEQAGRVHEFAKSHPPSNLGQLALIARMEDRLSQATVLAGIEQQAHIAARTAASERVWR